MSYCPYDISILEFTTDNKLSFILSEIYIAKPDILGFSCYIWNIEKILQIVSAVKMIMPDVIIIMGGPEVSFDAAVLLEKCSADIIVSGEGEETLCELLSHFKTISYNANVNNATTQLSKIKGITYRGQEGGIVTNLPREKLDLSFIPFPYNEKNIPENKIIYYESSRGCPFSCGYCLSRNEKPVRFLSLERVFSDLDFFITHKVSQVKFIDRTFNCDKDRALQIWKYIIDNDNGYTNFHFEISAEFLDDLAFNELKRVCEGLFQFEIGIQTTNIKTLETINRNSTISKLIENMEKLKSCKNIHVHLDLIAGLPDEGYQSFKESFNAVYALEPDMLQLGFLKLLKGSELREKSEEYGIAYDSCPPYEVLFTSNISFKEMDDLKTIENLVGLFYNSGNFKKSLKYIIRFFKDSFDFYEKFGFYWKENGYHKASQSLSTMFEILYEFSHSFCDEKILANLLKFDWYMGGNQKNPPFWLDKADNEDLEIINSLYKNAGMSKRFPIKKFDFDVEAEELEPHPVYVLFEYIGKLRPGSQKKSVFLQKFNNSYSVQV